MTSLTELRKLAEAATPGPYYVGHDDAPDCPVHRKSGLSSVDTGRSGDWPIARLCETPSANLIAALSPDRVLAMIEALEAAKAMRTDAATDLGNGWDTIMAFDAALAAFEKEQER